jgi:hypothetical protein
MDRRPDCAGRIPKDEEVGVALGPELLPAMCRDRFAQQAGMLSLQIAIPVCPDLLDQTS